ncbi:MAG TPA: hypothetical protein VE710_15910 [Candidatus Bathyarchaeia archaeon]|nr:hypothetical protein [Candidatus Bathyarchaeia archaeon]
MSKSVGYNFSIAGNYSSINVNMRVKLIDGDEMLDHDFADIVVALVIGFFLIFGFIGSRYGNNKNYEAEFNTDQIKDYFFKKHKCKDCNVQLKRISEKEYIGEGWTNMSGDYSYGKKYKVTFFLKCPNCNRVYTSDDF